MRQSLALIGTMAAIAAIAPAMATGTTKEAVPYGLNKSASSKAISPIFGAGDANPHKHVRKGFYNQRQHRKRLRQVPHLRHSKKFK